MFYLRRRWLRTLLAVVMIITGVSLFAAPPCETRFLFSFRDGLCTDGLSFINRVYKCVAPSVVGVESLREEEEGHAVIGTGSGVIVSEQGYIVTNHHVIANASGLTVTLYDGRKDAARLIAGDADLDLALLKIELGELTPAKLGTSSDLQVGDLVFPIGNPGGEQFAHSMTMGLISGLDRQLSLTEGNMEALLQTDAAINPGNSGGPLVDCRGVVIGINSAKIADADFEGMGFAIPADTVTAFLANALPAVFAPAEQEQLNFHILGGKADK